MLIRAARRSWRAGGFCATDGTRQARSRFYSDPRGEMTIDAIRTVAVLGAGTMGNGIAHVFARCGYIVILRDVEESFLDRARDTIAKNLDREVKKGKIEEKDKSKILGRIQTTTDLTEIARADFAVE